MALIFHSDTSLVFNTETTTSVSKTLAVQWDVQISTTSVSKTLAVQWDVQISTTSVSKTLAVQWSLAGEVAKSLALQWNVEIEGQQLVSRSSNFLWNISSESFLRNPSRLTPRFRQGALGTTAISGVGTFETTDLQLLEADAEWGPMDRAAWGRVMGTLLNDSFEMGIPARRLGSPSGLAKLDGAQSGDSVATTGWQANAQALLMPGEYVQIGNRLHMVLEQVDSDINGDATLQLWPAVLANVAANAVVRYTNPVGRWALKLDSRIESNEASYEQYTVRATLIEDR